MGARPDNRTTHLIVHWLVAPISIPASLTLAAVAGGLLLTAVAGNMFLSSAVAFCFAAGMGAWRKKIAEWPGLMRKQPLAQCCCSFQKLGPRALSRADFRAGGIER